MIVDELGAEFLRLRSCNRLPFNSCLINNPRNNRALFGVNDGSQAFGLSGAWNSLHSIAAPRCMHQRVVNDKKRYSSRVVTKITVRDCRTMEKSEQLSGTLRTIAPSHSRNHQ